MVIRDEIERLALFLEVHGGLHRAEIVADVEFSAGLETGEDSHGREAWIPVRETVKPHAARAPMEPPLIIRNWSSIMRFSCRKKPSSQWIWAREAAV